MKDLLTLCNLIDWRNKSLKKFIVDEMPSFFCELTSGISCWQLFFMDSIKLLYCIFEAGQNPCMNKKIASWKVCVTILYFAAGFLANDMTSSYFNLLFTVNATLAEVRPYSSYHRIRFFESNTCKNKKTTYLQYTNRFSVFYL